MKPEDFNQSMLNQMSKLKRNEVIQGEVAEEKRLQDNSKFFIQNYKMLDLTSRPQMEQDEL